jgi:hypothetical protein
MKKKKTQFFRSFVGERKKKKLQKFSSETLETKHSLYSLFASFQKETVEQRMEIITFQLKLFLFSFGFRTVDFLGIASRGMPSKASPYTHASEPWPRDFGRALNHLMEHTDKKKQLAVL